MTRAAAPEEGGRMARGLLLGHSSLVKETRQDLAGGSPTSPPVAPVPAANQQGLGNSPGPSDVLPPYATASVMRVQISCNVAIIRGFAWSGNEERPTIISSRGRSMYAYWP